MSPASSLCCNGVFRDLSHSFSSSSSQIPWDWWPQIFSIQLVPCLGFPLALPLFTVRLQHYKQGAGRQALFVDPSEGPGVNVEHLSQVGHP